MWVNTQYCGIDDAPTENKSLIILYRIGDEFNGRYRIGDGIGDGVNGKVGRCFEFMFVHNKIKNSIRKFNSKFSSKFGAQVRNFGLEFEIWGSHSKFGA